MYSGDSVSSNSRAISFQLSVRSSFPLSINNRIDNNISAIVRWHT